MECPVCKKEFDEKTGRRPKKFCSDACKVKFWNAFKKVRDNGTPENKKRILEEREKVSVKNFSQPDTPKDYTKKPLDNQSVDTTTKVYTMEELEAEWHTLTTLPDTLLTRNRKKFIIKKITELKTNNHG